jgi:hypothetical protein
MTRAQALFAVATGRQVKDSDGNIHGFDDFGCYTITKTPEIGIEIKTTSLFLHAPDGYTEIPVRHLSYTGILRNLVVEEI